MPSSKLGCVISVRKGREKKTMYEYRSSLIKIIDGDTIDVDLDLGFSVVLKKQRVRLAGINTPESRTRDREQKKYGLAAKARLKELLAEDSPLVIKISIDKKARGKYGRILGTVWKGNDNINEKLVDEGHAIAYYGGTKNATRWWELNNNPLNKEHVI